MLATELSKLKPHEVKATEVSLYKVMSVVMAEMWIKTLNEVVETAGQFPDKPAAEFMVGLARRENTRMISNFMESISDVCKEGIPDGES